MVVAHRLSTVRNADKIIAFDAGQVVESGTHEALKIMDGIYAKLCSAQQFISNIDGDDETAAGGADVVVADVKKENDADERKGEEFVMEFQEFVQDIFKISSFLDDLPLMFV